MVCGAAGERIAATSRMLVGINKDIARASLDANGFAAS
jgi:hypothetical protein